MLRFRIDCGDGWYRAMCPELHVYGGGQSREEAKQSLFEAARVTAKYVAGLTAARNEPRLPYARVVLSHWSDVESVFEDASE